MGLEPAHPTGGAVAVGTPTWLVDALAAGGRAVIRVCGYEKCGKPFLSTLRNVRAKYCSARCSMAKNHELARVAMVKKRAGQRQAALAGLDDN